MNTIRVLKIINGHKSDQKIKINTIKATQCSFDINNWYKGYNFKVWLLYHYEV